MQQIRLGLVDFSSANIAQNQIRYGVLELLREIEEQEVKTPDIKAEVERFAVNIEKNIVKNSTITAGGNVAIGDTNITTQQNQYGSGDNVAGNKVEYHYYNGIKIPRFLTQKPFYTNFFIGRETDLAAIETDYQKNNHLLVLVNGEGGMGKTTLAAQYWFRHETRYTHLAWVFADRGIGNALISLSGSLGVTFSPNDNEATQIIRITEAINNLDAPCLLVFDNANDATDLEKHFVTLRRLSNCQVLLTSRVTALQDVPVHRVKPLDSAFAVQVFTEHYPKYSESDAPLLNSLLHAVGFNTLVIELLAKNLTVFNKFKTQYSLATLVADLQQRGLFAVQGKAVKTLYQADTLRTETPDSIIAAMYDVSALSDMERYLLNNFAVLPAENIPYTRFIELLKPDNSDIFDDPLSSLQQKGWIDYFESTHDFKISPVIQHITKLKNKTTLLYDGKTLIDTLIKELQRDNIHKDNYTFSAIFSRYAETVVAAFDAPKYNAIVLCQRIGTYYTTIGNLDRAIAFYEKSRAISQELCVLQPDNEHNKNVLAISYQYLGNTHTSLGNLDKALGFYEEQNKLSKELYAANPNNEAFKNGLAVSFQFLGNMHTRLGNWDKALGFYEEQNKLSKELYAANTNNVEFKNVLAVSYQYLGITHTSLGNLDKALRLYEEDLKLSKELYSANPNNVAFKNGLAVSFQFLGNTHTSLGNLDKALGFYEEYNRLENELYAANPNNVEFKNGLAISYSKLGETHTSLGNLDKALELYNDEVKLFEELYAANPNNVAFKNGLAVSYQYLGNTHTSLGNLDKALGFYKEYNRLENELYAANPNNVEFKNGLAISYSKLGETHTSLGNLDKALELYNDEVKLFEELYAANPNNVAFKNGLAISYYQLGRFYQDKKHDKKQARIYFEECQTLWTELATSFPSYVEFQKNLEWVQDRLSEQ
jgi:tetratricopeptide (TPR) repeat protein